MGILAKKAKTFTPPPKGPRQGLLVDVEDLGLQQTTYGEKDVVRFTFQIKERTQEGKRYEVKRPLTNNTHEKSNLRNYIEVLGGGALSTKELEDYDLETLIGENCQLQLVHVQGRDGQTYANIQTIVPLMEGTPLMYPEDYIRVVDREKKEP